MNTIRRFKANGKTSSKSSRVAPVFDDRRTREIWNFVFKRGGVAGAVRRFVFKQSGVFSSADIHGAVYGEHPPNTEPGEFQIQDCIDDLQRRKLIEYIECGSASKLYRRVKRFRQLKLKLRFCRKKQARQWSEELKVAA